TIDDVEHRGMNSLQRRWVLCNGSGPRVQLTPSDPGQTARCVQPERTIVVLDHPVHGVAGQSVLHRQHVDPAILDASEPALSGQPERAVAVTVKSTSQASSHALRRTVRRGDVAIFEIFESAGTESQPKAAADGVGEHDDGRALQPE